MAAENPPGPPVRTPDGRYLVVKGRLWRATNPSLSKARRAALTRRLMAARRAVAKALKSKDGRGLKRARAAVDSAKRSLGERGKVWWSDEAPDYNRYLVKNTPYAAWYARRTRRRESRGVNAMKSAVPVFLIFVVGAGASVQSFAQVPADCPTVLVASAAEVNSPDAAEFRVSVKGGSADVDAQYDWSVTAGTISSGQGTSQVLVATDGMAAGDVIKATVEVNGYPGSCDTSASASVTVVKKAYKVFEGAYTDDAELARLLDVLIDKRVADGKSYVVFYSGIAAPAGDLDRVKQAAKAHIEGKGQSLEDFPFMDGGRRDRTTIEFWMAGPGDDAPALSNAN